MLAFRIILNTKNLLAVFQGLFFFFYHEIMNLAMRVKKSWRKTHTEVYFAFPKR